ncbi:putative Sulfotransferase domain-containing protein [Burkholderia cepacia]|uniref:sulfotransferase n=1 Tax=Burkholderia cepacia TaxID=292 RepID=UPI0039A55A12
MSGLQDKSLEWLVVGGAPRSGTTALGAALNRSAEIALFHEYSSWTFFDSLDSIFREERRLRKESGFENHAHLMPIQERDEQALALAIFRRVFDKTPRYIGTKFPGHHAWPQPRYPAWIGFREIWITRNPYDVVISMLRKDHGDKATTAEAESALYWWVSAWNHAMRRRADANFFHIFYDSLIVSQQSWRDAVARFLDVGDFNFDDMKSVSDVPPRDKFVQAGFGHFLPLLDLVAESLEWFQQAAPGSQSGEPIGFPLIRGASIDLRGGGNGYRYVQTGFYPPEEAGSWTQGRDAELLFSPDCDRTGPLLIKIHVVWVAEHHGRGRRVEAFLNGIKIFDTVITLGARNGIGESYTIYLPATELRRGRSASLMFRIEDPINPSVIGVSNDTRSLGVMISEIEFVDG